MLRGRLKWATHMERLGDTKVTNTADAQNVEAKRVMLSLSVSVMVKGFLRFKTIFTQLFD